jgi:uncharacterized protein GlcG (DUF336 family)
MSDEGRNDSVPNSGERLSLAEARAMIDRGLEKMKELRQAGSLIVVDEAGSVVSISRMEGGSALGLATGRAKAALAAISHATTDTFSKRMDEHPVRYAAYLRFLPYDTFPGAGAAPIKKAGRVVGGISTGGIQPRKEMPGVDPAKFIVDGVQGYAEDIVICHALQIPYKDQH